MSANRNHPQKGSSILTEPIRDIRSIIEIRRLMREKGLFRDDLLFTMGINNSTRINELLQLKVGDVQHLEPGSCITIKGGCENRQNLLVINNEVHKALHKYLDHMYKNGKGTESEYLFQSRKGGSPISLSCVNAMVKQWTTAVNLSGNYGATSLRKTWGYHQRERFKVRFKVLSKRLNHTSRLTTAQYLCIEKCDEAQLDYILMHNEIGVMSSREA